ncbi:methylcrotonoyl-CoA carboxylase subunit alpha, mitochondrial-like [Halichondria panicea]|uniref:methylcrotonoyl-CoA carboxylase subunit alpha, mitochondrial-like n=1 Tax=Halichondria panicea TaxID=6063 RepID=UPI00312B3304
MAALRCLRLPLVGQKRHLRSVWLCRELSGDSQQLFDKILVANRGEIACRVMRTAHRLGIRSVAVFSEADRNTMHADMADEAYCIGPAPSSESYLRQDKIIEVAKATGAQAIHPGYGFLSENKHFAELCTNEGVEFVGPPPSAIEKMGVKRVSKRIMSESGVPVVPGYFGEDQSDPRLKVEADKMGYPVMIKADLGGGGKGMRIVPSADHFQEALDACRSEALKSFGDDKVMVEKFVERPRHVEIQIFADKQGNTVHLFERDCSVQRRHQKIIEEAPAPGLRSDVREGIYSAAVSAAQAVGYVGAGTVEFIMDAQQKFYFMEMNTRLQVEHPITEMITGTDLVEWQLRVAAGRPLPIKNQSELVPRGHAFEARIYAENPDKNFIPSPGHLHHLCPPTTSQTIRVDTGVKQGDEVKTYYDPMIAKLAVWAEDRESSLKKLTESLKHYQVAGVSTNIDFLQRLSSHPQFIEGDVHTGFIEQHSEALFPPPQPLPSLSVMEAALSLLALEGASHKSTEAYVHDPFSPFCDMSAQRVNTVHNRTVCLKDKDNTVEVDVSYRGNNRYTVSMGDSSPMEASSWLEEGGTVKGFVGERTFQANVALVDRQLHIFTRAGSFSVELPMAEFVQKKQKSEEGGVRSPKYPSTVVRVGVAAGDKVTKGTIVMTVEGMKMESNIMADKDGVIKSVFYDIKDSVPPFSKVVEFNK